MYSGPLKPGSMIGDAAYTPIVVPGARDATSVVPESRSDIRNLLGSMTNLVQWLFCLSLPVDEIPAFAGTTGIKGFPLVQGRGGRHWLIHPLSSRNRAAISGISLEHDYPCSVVVLSQPGC